MTSNSNCDSKAPIGTFNGVGPDEDRPVPPGTFHSAE